MVQLEQLGELVRVVDQFLQPLDQCELALDQTEGAQREVDVGAVDVVLQGAQARGERVLPTVQQIAFRGEGVPYALELGVLGVLRGDAPAQPVHLGAERVDRPGGRRELVGADDPDLLVGGDVPAGEAVQGGGRAGDGAGRGDADAEDEQEAHRGEGDVEFESRHVVVAQRGEPVGGGRRERGLDTAHHVDPGGERRLDRSRLERAVGGGQRGVVQQLLEPLVGLVDVGAGDRLVVLLDRGLRGPAAEVGECGPLADRCGLRGAHQAGLPAARGERAHQQAALDGGLVDGAGEFGQRGGVGGGAAGGQRAGDGGADPVQRPDRRVVGRRGGLDGAGAGEHLLPDGGEFPELPDDLGGRVGEGGGVVGVGVGRRRQHLLGLAVDPHPLGLGDAVAALGGAAASTTKTAMPSRSSARAWDSETAWAPSRAMPTSRCASARSRTPVATPGAEAARTVTAQISRAPSSLCRTRLVRGLRRVRTGARYPVSPDPLVPR